MTFGGRLQPLARRPTQDASFLFSHSGKARLTFAWSALGVAVLLGACDSTTETTTSPSDSEAEVVAHYNDPRYGDLSLTVAEVDARVLALPPAKRPAPGADLDAWYRDLIREMVVEALLRSEAESEGLEQDSAFAQARREAEKQQEFQLCLAELRPDFEKIGEPELKAAYESRLEQFSAPERRLVYHLFLRRARDRAEQELRSEIEELRARVLRGESFSRLAEERSESEGRHRRGFVGWVVRGTMPAGFEKVVFDLEEGVPSEPVVTHDGMHLFYVEQALPARSLSFAEARPKLREILVAERSRAAVEKLVAEIKMPPGSKALDREQLDGVIEAGDSEATVLRIGPTELSYADLRRFVARQRDHKGRPTIPMNKVGLWQVLEQARRRELLHHHCRESGQIPTEAMASRMSKWREAALLHFQRRRRLTALAEADEQRLRLFYQSNIGDFSSRPQWQVRLLEVPLGTDSQATMVRLEKAAAAGETLDAVAAETGGRIEDLGFIDVTALNRISAKLPTLITPLEPGSLTPPYRDGERLEMAEVVARRQAEPLPFEEVRARVVAAYVDQYTHELYEELETELMGDGSKLEIHPEALASLRETGLPRPDVSIEDLEALLEGP